MTENKNFRSDREKLQMQQDLENINHAYDSENKARQEAEKIIKQLELQVNIDVCFKYRINTATHFTKIVPKRSLRKFDKNFSSPNHKPNPRSRFVNWPIWPTLRID